MADPSEAIVIRRPMANRRERLAQMRRHYRVRGFDDGFAGRPAASTNIEYAQSWRRGREARETGGAA